ncbi:MAG: radical SAM protein [Planctomycetota bacterium]|nr:radical SAM protein [Planctomycetota bacterium]
MPGSGERTPQRTIALLRPHDAAGAAPTSQGDGANAATPPVGLLETAAAVRSSDRLTAAASLRLALIDGVVDPDGTQGAVSRTLELGPDAVVLGADGADAPGALREAGQQLAARRRSPTDGPLRVALLEDDPETAEQLLRDDSVDVVLRGEAEEPIANLLGRAFEGERGWEGVRGVSWRTEGGDVRHELSASRPAQLPLPAWDLVDLEDYRPAPEGGRLRALLAARGLAPRSSEGIVTLRTTRSCGPNCPTCRGSFGHTAVKRPVDDVLREVRELVARRHVRVLRLGDDAFDGDPGRAEAIARGIARIAAAPHLRGFRLELPRGLRGDGLSPSLVDALTEAGLRRFVLDIGTASPRLQRLLKRNIDLDRAAAALEMIDRAGARGHLRLFLGLPTETTGEAAHTIRWSARSAAHTASFVSGADHDLGSLWQRRDEHDFDDFPALRRRALFAFYVSARRARRLLRAAPRILLTR